MSTSARPEVAERYEPLDRAGRGSMAAVRIIVGLLWLTNVGWKVPRDFGQNDGAGLYGFVQEGIKEPGLPGWDTILDKVVVPQFGLFGWITVLTELSLGAFLLLGLATRFWAVVGIVQSIAIGLTVLKVENEWPWSYYLMIAANLALFATAAGRYLGLDGVIRPLLADKPSRFAQLLRRVS